MKRRREIIQPASPAREQASFQSYMNHFSVCCFPCPERYDSKMKRKDNFCTVRLILVFMRTIGLVLLYFSFSIGITFYQKWFIKVCIEKMYSIFICCFITVGEILNILEVTVSSQLKTNTDKFENIVYKTQLHACSIIYFVGVNLGILWNF